MAPRHISTDILWPHVTQGTQGHFILTKLQHFTNFGPCLGDSSLAAFKMPFKWGDHLMRQVRLGFSSDSLRPGCHTPEIKFYWPFTKLCVLKFSIDIDVLFYFPINQSINQSQA
jgi:hypothetical protein